MISFQLSLHVNDIQFPLFQGCFFITSGLGENLVMDVAYCRTTPGTQVISYTRNNPPRANQLWTREFVSNNKKTFYLVSKLHSSCKITIKVINCCNHLYLLLKATLMGLLHTYRVGMLALTALAHFFKKRKMESSSHYMTRKQATSLM